MIFWDEVEDNRSRKSTFSETRNAETEEQADRYEKKKSYGDSVPEKEVNIQEIVPKEGETSQVVLMTAVEDEYKAARKVFGVNKNVRDNYDKGFKYCLMHYQVGEDKVIDIVLFRQYSMGLVSAAMTATCALTRFRPELLLMCGVCAGVQDNINLGDLVVFTPVFDYGAGKREPGTFSADFHQRQLNGKLYPMVEEMSEDRMLLREIMDTWDQSYGKPDTELKIHICPGGSGAAVITDEEIVKEIKDHQRKLGAIDMEAFAVAEVASTVMGEEIPWLVVKGVQDRATPMKNDKFRDYSSHVSAVFMKKFLERFYAGRQGGYK